MDGSSRVPASGDGEVINIARDYLGSSVFVSHGEGSGKTLVSALGHMVPAEGLEPGAHLGKGDIIGKLSEYDDMPVPPHLHISLFRAEAGDLAGIDWQGLRASGSTRFIDPLCPG
jgi:hypothetical protein